MKSGRRSRGAVEDVTEDVTEVVTLLLLPPSRPTVGGDAS
jgi:hypothetical protein